MTSVMETIKNLFSKNSGSTYDTTALFKSIDVTSESLKVLSVALQNPALIADFSASINAREGRAGPRRYFAGEVYDKYYHHLPLKWRAIDDKQRLSSITTIVNCLSNDLRDIMSNYKEYFANETLTEKDIRLSNLIISGYVTSASKFVDWLQWMLISGDHFDRHGKKTDEKNHNAPARYIVKSVNDCLSYVYDLENEVLTRRPGVKFLSILTTMRENNKDYAVTNNGMDLTVYAEDGDFNAMDRKYMTSGLLNPFLFFSRHRAEVLRDKYEKNKDLKEWITNHIALLERQQSGLDPNSEEYKKIEGFMKNYLDQIAKLDEKIERYETQY